MDNPQELKYTESHEWAKFEHGEVEVGITFHAQEALGELVYVELPFVGQAVKAGEAFVVVESTKAASDVYSPIDGEIIAINEDLSTTPEIVNTDPFTKGWLVRIRPTDSQDPLQALLSAEEYTSRSNS